MPRVRLEPTIPVFERAKTFRALDRAATVIDTVIFWGDQIWRDEIDGAKSTHKRDNAYKILVAKPDLLGNLGVEWQILQRILKKQGVWV
jgi:hypothetical protein